MDVAAPLSASTSCSPSDEEFGRWMRWLELAREELADALDGAGDAAGRGAAQP